MQIAKHIPVLAEEILKLLDPQKGQVFVDATLGLGGHSEMILRAIGDTGFLYAFECDEQNMEVAKKNLTKWKKNCRMLRQNYAQICEVLMDKKVNGILFDLGISSVHLDDPKKGFSFRTEGPLDMRIDKDTQLTAYDIVNSYSEEELCDVLRNYGEEPDAKKIARSIVQERREKPIKNTIELSEIISRLKKNKRWGGGHPAAQSFQALRIEVNSELENLKKGLMCALSIIKKGGRVAVISFHSLEDRIVKNIFREAARACVCPKEIPKCVCGGKPKFKIITRKPIYPTEKEIKQNSRARSARLRVIEKVI